MRDNSNLDTVLVADVSLRANPSEFRVGFMRGLNVGYFVDNLIIFNLRLMDKREPAQDIADMPIADIYLVKLLLLFEYIENHL